MLDPNEYRNACARLTLGQEKMEEFITMTENTNKRRLGRPLKTVLIAAACIAALCVTAFAAPAVQRLFMSATITSTVNGDDPETAQMFVCPDLALEEQDGKHILTVGEDEIDVTDAFAQDGQYVLKRDGATLTVKPDGLVSVEMATDDGPIVYSFNLTDSDGSLPSSLTVEGDALEGGDVVSYTVTADESGAINVTPAD